MTSIPKPQLRHPQLPRNKLGLTLRDYEGIASTLCAGCGHDAITAALVQSLFELNVAAEMVGKLSGIGCSSKSTAYFLARGAWHQCRAWAYACYCYGCGGGKT